MILWSTDVFLFVVHSVFQNITFTRKQAVEYCFTKMASTSSMPLKKRKYQEEQETDNGQKLLLSGLKKYLMYLPDKKQIYYQMFSITDDNEMILSGISEFEISTFDSVRQLLNTLCKLSQIEMFDLSEHIINSQILTIPRFIFAYKSQTKNANGECIDLYKLLLNNFNVKYFFNPLRKHGKTSIIFDFNNHKSTFYVPSIFNQQIKSYQHLKKIVPKVTLQNEAIIQDLETNEQNTQLVLLLVKSEGDNKSNNFQVKFYLLKQFLI